MDLSGIYGFPLWERPVFVRLLTSNTEIGLQPPPPRVRLLASFDELEAFFAFYAAGDDGGSAESIEHTELVDLALDCGFVTEQFSMARVAEVFASTDRESREISGGERSRDRAPRVPRGPRRPLLPPRQPQVWREARQGAHADGDAAGLPAGAAGYLLWLYLLWPRCWGEP
eukprot:scaffold2842_cov60-Phaeocystis_antarctica.AAC.6